MPGVGLQKGFKAREGRESKERKTSALEPVN